MSHPTPAGGIPAIVQRLPEHLQGWQLPPGWAWGEDGVRFDYRHYQQISDALGRWLSLVSVPDPAHAAWLDAEARLLGRLDHPSIPTTYHYWTKNAASPRGPGYLRRWIAGETVGVRLRRLGPEGVSYSLALLRAVGSALAYLHDGRVAHGAVSLENVWASPTGRLWLIGWQWAVGPGQVPDGLQPDPHLSLPAPEWDGGWVPTPASDQWQLAAMAYASFAGELPPRSDIPPLALVAPDVPAGVAAVIDRALAPDPAARHASVAALLRSIDRMTGSRQLLVSGLSDDGGLLGPAPGASDEVRVRWATGEDYEVLSALGRGAFGSVWRVRDLALGREVAMKVLHEEIARDDRALARFRREARLAAQLSHPAIVPIFSWDTRGSVAWYTMELAESGSLAQLVAARGPRPLVEVAPQVHQLLDALAAAHQLGVIHRDLKPENVLIDRWFRWRLTDFGIANVLGEDTTGASGTPAFAAPEQLLGEPQGPQADLFAVAGIVFFALTGQPPFTAQEPQAILAQQLSGRRTLEAFHPAVAAWLRQGLSASADDRFADAQAMKLAWLDAAETAIADEQEGASWWNRLVRGLGAGR
jgi:serine/threonine-protein kinase